MAKIGDVENNLEGYLDQSMEWFDADKLGKVHEPGFLTVAQVASLIIAQRSHNRSTPDVSEGLADFIMLACVDIAKGELEARHPVTMLPWTQYVRMIETGMYEDGDESPMLTMGWLVALDDAEQWYAAKGFNVDLTKGPDDMEALKTGALPDDGGDQTDAPLSPKHASSIDDGADLSELFDGVRYEALNKMFPGAGDWKNLTERANRNGLKEAAKIGHALFNPMLAALWWLNAQNPPGWDIARVYRTLANNLPAKNRHLGHLLTGDYD